MISAALTRTTFCVLDSKRRERIHNATSFARSVVKAAAGETAGTFHTLVNPGVALPPQITVITGLTDAVLAPAPRIEQVITSSQFIGDAVFVAHNAPFDLGFVAAFERAGIDDFTQPLSTPSPCRDDSSEMRCAISNCTLAHASASKPSEPPSVRRRPRNVICSITD